MVPVPGSSSGVPAAGALSTLGYADLRAAQAPANTPTQHPPDAATQPTVHAATIPLPAYLPVLDGLRAVSILLVLLSHLGLDHVVPGAFGVTLFFFISGYLITRQLCAGLARDGRIGFGPFYLRRALRLVPAGAAYILVSGLAYLAQGGFITARGWLAALFYGANYYDLWAGYHSTLAGVRHPFNILWSLAIEEHFYLLWPACLALLWHAGRQARRQERSQGQPQCRPNGMRRARRALGALALLCAAILVWRLYLWNICFVAGAPWVCGPENPNPLWRYNRLYLATDTRVDSIAWGSVLAMAQGAWRTQADALHTTRATRLWAAAGVVMLAASFLVPGPFGRHVLRPSLQGLALLGLFPWLLNGDSVLHHVLRCAPARMLGRLSYSLYLWHWLALGIADALLPGQRLVWGALAVVLAFALATASYACIERPMLRIRRRAGSHAPAA